MTDEIHSQDNQNGKTGTALAPAAESGGIDPFVASVEAAPSPFRGLGAKLLDYSAHAAIIVGLVGFAWTVGSHLTAKPTAAQIEAPTPASATATAAAKPTKIDELAELRQANAQMAADIKTLHANLDALRANVKQDKTPNEVRALEAELSTTRSKTDAALAQLAGKVDKLGHMERQSVDTTATGSIGPSSAEASLAPKSIPTPPIKPTNAKLATADEEGAKPVLSGWVVRDVYEGVALIESKRGTMEIVPGVSIPGAGVVKSIDRHGNGWTVTTSKGLLAYAAPAHDFRRPGPRMYQDYPSDY